MNQPQPAFRVGLGYDIHPLVAGRPCVLGGVNIPSDVGPDGHSDADVVLHAVADAILGAAGLRDIGHYFPNTDAAIKGLDSAVIVQKAVTEAKANGGWVVGNVDVVIIGERPKVMAHVEAMKAKLAGIIGISPVPGGHQGHDQRRNGLNRAGEGPRGAGDLPRF